MQRLFALCLLAVLATTHSAQAQEITKETLSTINVSAQVDIKAAPDMATLAAGVVTTAATADGALKENSTRMNAVFAALTKAGIPTKDFQTEGLNISPQYKYVENQAPVVTGYQATNSVNITLRDLNKIGPVIDTLVAQGANQINGPHFGIEDKDALMDKARNEAVKKARRRADIYAGAAGVKVTRLVSLNEQAGFMPQTPYPAIRAMAADMSAASTPVSPGELTLNLSINATYEVTP